ncbi:MAG: replication factor C large subunit [Methanomassiliicoccales archaeon]|nr:replication factor C large subunit [Methanomassiliicoccales archaeon]
MSEDWTELYRPKSLKEVVGNPKAVKELKDWAIAWENGTPPKRVAVLIGPPGVGKTSTALALASEFGWGVVEMNASDQRNGEAIRRIALRGALSDTFTDSGDYLSHREGRKKLIILDEADNLFGREDKGAIPAIVELIAKTMHPVVLIVNDFYGLSRKSSAIKDRTLQIKFTKIAVPTVRTLLRKIAADRSISAPEGVLEIIAKNSNGDLRAAIRDLQALGLGNPELREEQALALDNRLTSKSMYDLMAEIFQGTSPRNAQRMAWDIQETPEFIMLWVEENLPLAYRDTEDLWRGFHLLARADIMLGRVARRQYFALWGYATDLSTYGVCAAKSKPYRGFVRYQFPSYLLKMGRTKAARGAKLSVSQKVGSYCHTSSRYAMMDLLPYISVLFRSDQEFRLAAMELLGLDEEDAAFLMGEKIDSSAVKHLIQALERKRSGESEEHDLRTTRLDEIEEKAAPEDKAPDESIKQKSLFEY